MVANQSHLDLSGVRQSMRPGEFIAKWRASTLKESSASQEHFIDLREYQNPWGQMPRPSSL